MNEKQSKPFYHVLLSASGVSLLVQVLAILRQALIANYYGISRDLDLFVSVYAMAGVSVFSFNTIIETAYTALLVKIRDDEGEVIFRQSLCPFLAGAFLLGLAASIIFLIVSPLLALIYGAGFQPLERQRLTMLTWCFLPWIMSVIPYYGAAAILKSSLNYSWAFYGEGVVTLISMLSIFLFHDKIEKLPFTYAIAYLLTTFIFGVKIVRMREGRFSMSLFPFQAMYRRIYRHYGALQYSALSSFAERYWFSFLSPGSIAAMGIAQQLTVGMSGLLSFRDAYLVPLASEDNRADRLRRLMVGLALMTIIVSIGVIFTSEDIIHILFNYGKVTADKISLISTLLLILACALLPSSLSWPVWRVLQVEGQHRAFLLFSTFNALSCFIGGGILVGWLHLGVKALALLTVCNSYLGLIWVLWSAKTFGVKLKMMDGAVIACVTVVCLLAATTAFSVGQFGMRPVGSLLLFLTVYGLVSLAGIWGMKSKLLKIVMG